MEESKEGAIANGASHYNLQAELQQQYELLLDKSQRLEDRLEAFDFITDSEIGDTPLLRARNLERELGFRQIYLKLEGGNPTGTQKDRIAFAQCADALRRGFDGICLATCGNYGVACALAAKYSGLDCVIYIPEAYHTRRAEEMWQLGAKTFTIKVNGSAYEVQLADQYDQLVNRLGLGVVSEHKVREIRAPMPGLVLDISVEIGQHVQKGDPLLILEAMKMENVLKSQGDGVVKAIRVEKGEAVDKNALLIEMD